MVEPKFTPGPWVQDGFEIYSDDCEYHPVANSTPNHTCRDDEEGYANAAHIVKCVNMHDELVEALKAIHLQALQSSVNDTSNDYGREALDMAYEALKKAGAL